MDHEVLVYKVDNSVQSSLLSSLVLILIQGSIYWLTLRSLSHNKKSQDTDSQETPGRICKHWSLSDFKCYDSKLSSDYNLGKSLSKKGDNNQLVKYKNIGSYLQLYLPKDYEKRKRCSWGNNKKEIRKKWGGLYYYYMRY